MRDTTLAFKTLGVRSSRRLRDLLDHKDLDMVAGSFSASVPRHGVVLLRVFPIQRPR